MSDLDTRTADAHAAYEAHRAECNRCKWAPGSLCDEGARLYYHASINAAAVDRARLRAESRIDAFERGQEYIAEALSCTPRLPEIVAAVRAVRRARDEAVSRVSSLEADARLLAQTCAALLEHDGGPYVDPRCRGGESCACPMRHDVDAAIRRYVPNLRKAKGAPGEVTLPVDLRGAMFGTGERAPALPALDLVDGFNVGRDGEESSRRIERRRGRDRVTRWAVVVGNHVADADGSVEYEPMPSSRDDAFLARTRFDFETACDVVLKLTGVSPARVEAVRAALRAAGAR